MRRQQQTGLNTDASASLALQDDSNNAQIQTPIWILSDIPVSEVVEVGEDSIRYKLAAAEAASIRNVVLEEDQRLEPRKHARSPPT